MTTDRVKFQDIVASQLPSFIRDDFPLLSEFLEQYYISQETQGASLDLLQNIDKYVNVDQLTGLKSSTILHSDITVVDDEITTNVDGNFTEGFVERNGLIKIDDEIIAYSTKTDTTFEGCVRGFSGITSYTSPDVPDRLSFAPTSIPASHKKGAIIQNLNVLFLQEFFKKLKSQVSPGFGDRTLKTNQKNFIINSDSFYKTKGTDLSYKILFKALFGETVDIIRPSRFLLKPSSASYSVTEDIVVRATDIGDPLNLKNLTLFQDSTNARGTVNSVSKIQYNEEDYYQLSIDSGYDRDINVTGTRFGKFKPNPKTKLLTGVSAGATCLDVDSTISFPETGKLEVVDIDNNLISIAYTGKSVNQFYNVSGISNTLNDKVNVTLDDYSYAYVGIGTDEDIRVKITSTLKDLKLGKNYYYNKKDTINIKSFGIEDETTRGSNWLINSKSKWQILSLVLTDALENKYDVITYDDHTIKPGYSIILSDNGSNTAVAAKVLEIKNDKEFTVKAQSALNVNRLWSFENQILKVDSPKNSFLGKYIANVQNTYTNFNDDVLIASNSLPVYDDTPLEPYKKRLKFTGSSTNNIIDFGTDHGFYTGDAIYYQPGISKITTITPDGNTVITENESKFDGVDSSVYYVQKINDKSIKLSRSRSDLFRGITINLSGTVTDNTFTYFNFYNKPLEPQGIYRQITNPIREAGDFETLPGFNGMFINGVELLNYKSDDTIFYGPIQELIVTNGGTGYDVVNPPRFTIADTVGSGATGTVAVEGSLERIDLIDTGFDFLETPIVKISGGNPVRQASASVNISPITYEVNINTEFNGNVDIGNNRIGFSSFHKFKQAERIIYDSRGLQSVGGLSTDSSYYVNVLDNFNVTLHNKPEDANSGINTVTFQNTFGQGTQALRSAERKNVVTSVIVTDPGEGYKNKERLIPSAGIVTALNQVKITNHGYETGEVVKYTSGSTSVLGLTETKDYYVNKVDKDTFTLREVGTGSTSLDYFLKNKIDVNIQGEGVGTFNYKPITVTVEGVTGITTRSGQDFQCKVQPVFRGHVDSIDMTSQGSKYGSPEIINLNRQPKFSFDGGQKAQVLPIINNGRFVDIVIENQGSDYVSPPELTITGAGNYAVLTPIIRDGKLVDIKIINPGLNYVNGETSITITNRGLDAQVESKIKEWNINLFARNLNFIKDDDGIIEESISGDTTEYSHIYSPRKLRESTYAIKNNGDTFYGITDLEKSNGLEVSNSLHSPILGWAYDGNPIYGPNGYTTPEGGVVKQLKSGYEIDLQLTHRPPINLYPEGFFIEDFKFTNSGDLDVHNGRFCITPDYPEGVYAYFTTLETFVDSSGPFRNYKRPQFPYVIGNTFHSKRIDFNYSTLSNQTDYDIQSNEWFRNTKSYNTNNTYSGYDYIFDSNKIKKQSLEITSTSKGTIESIGIFTGGRNYQVNDTLLFDNSQSGGKGVQAKVYSVGGIEVDTVSCATTTTPDIEFIKYFGLNQFVGFSSTPHNFKNNQLVNVNGLSDYYKGFDGPYNVGVRTESFISILGIGTTGTTGLTTYFYIDGALEFPFIRPNDTLGIGTETVKVLNIDADSKRIRVVREQDGTVGASYTTGTALFGDPRKFIINVSSAKTDKSFRLNEELYFEPAESVGIGTTTGNGVGTVVTFRNPGVGATSIFIQPQAIFYENHGLKLNDRLVYSTNSGSTLGVWNGISTNFRSLNEFDDLYAAPITKDFIGISSHKIGLSTTGGYVGLTTTTGLFFFTSLGSGEYHSFKTNRTDILRTQIDRHIVTVSTASTHGLVDSDNVKVNIKPTSDQVVDVRFNAFNRRIVFNPVGFTSDNVDTQFNTLTISNHTYVEGDKVIHTSSDPAAGLVNNEMYYVIPFNKDKIRLVSDRFEIERENPAFINITSRGSGGTLSKINPLVVTRRNNNLKFDLSDSSLSFLSNGVRYSAFKMSVYLDQEFNKEFVTTGKKEDKSFEVSTSGSVGVDADANLTVEISDYVPVRLYYKFDPINTSIISESQRGLVTDKDSSPFNQINVEKSKYDGHHQLTGTGSTFFTYELPTIPESVLYTKSNSNSNYTTQSLKSFGPISKIEIVNNGGGYTKLPKIEKVISGIGTDAILEAQSQNIGNILGHRFDSKNIGFDYPTDETLRPEANLPEILEMESLTSFDSIGISSFGRNYLHPANLKVIDGYTNRILNEVDLKYEIGDTSVTILNNTTGMYDVTPRIIPTQNTNGVGISSLSYDSSTKVVRVYLNQTFSTAREFPYNVGKKILVENVSILSSPTGQGYNSSDYNYTLFPIITSVPQFGGTGAYIEYSLKDVLKTGEIPGTVDTLTTIGQIVAEEYFPVFNPVLTTNDFLVGEKVFNGDKTGVVESWTPNIEQLKIDTPKDFDLGTVVRGESSNTQAVILKKWDFDAEIQTGVGATVIGGWQNNVGFLNNNLQVLPNNEYYQNFSYSLSSKVPYKTWDDPVSNLNHTSGFAKFADYQSESVETNPGKATVDPIESNVEVVIDIIGEGDLNCVHDFDLVSEGTKFVNGNMVSDEIFFENRILTDYFQSVGNRVLSIDDISGSFNSNERAEKFEPIGKFESNYVFNKVFTFAKDVIFTDERQFSIVNLIQNAGIGYINEYSTLETYPRLGYFDYQLSSPTEWELTFHPVKFAYNSYNTSILSISLLDGVSGTGSTSFGNVVSVASSQTSVSSGTTTTIASFPTTNRSAKILTMIEATSGISSGQYDSTEINIIHDGTTVTKLEYGDMQNTLASSGTLGLGTYHSYIDSGVVKVDFIPSITGNLESQTSLTLISDTNTTTGNYDLDVARLKSTQTTIASSGSPTANVISSYNTPYSASYNVVLVTDTTNSQYEMFEFGMCNSSSNQTFVEYGNIRTGANLGQVGVSSSGTTKNITYTPIAGIDVEVRTFAIDLMIFDSNTNPVEIDHNNVVIKSNGDGYKGTKLDLVTEFGLYHDGNEIFRRVFDGSSSSSVNTTSKAIAIPNHFFVTGEEVRYSHPGAGTTQAIGIAPTNIPGIGVTDKLPTNLFIVKVDDGRVRFASTAENALKFVPEILPINSVGIGVSHVITSTNQNAKALVAVDNMIQAPVSPTSIGSTLNQDIMFHEVFSVTGITSFASGDILKIDDEYLITTEVGIAGSTQFGVRRAQLGSAIGFHTSGATITKIGGNYNIVGNNINFASAPYGNTPLSTTATASPDQRDWTGITTSSSFQGRTFMRTAPVNSNKETYSKNYVFDDVSHKFNGINTSFTLDYEGSSTVGYSTDNGVILINNIFQQPEGAVTGDGTYSMEESVGVTTVTFTGVGVTTGYDPNNSDIPIGGLIVSVGSESGFGYQPLVAAGGIVNVSTAGTIASISIGNSGSGYRSGVQVVSVGVQQTGDVDLVPIGTATISGGNIVGVAITNPEVFYVPRDVSNVGYTSITGITTITTSTNHGLTIGDEVKVTGIAFTCDYPKALPVSITNVVYDNVTGIMTVTTSGAHNLQISGQRSDVLLTGIAMTCGLDGGASTHIYPRTTDPAYCGSKVTAVNSSTEFETNVGVSTVATFYQSGGVAQPVLIAPRTNNHSASGSDPASNSSTVLDVIDSTTFVINSGISTRKHFYARCGTVGKPYDVVFDDPLSYSNIPVQYSSSGPTGAGKSATVNIVVGQGSSVIDFEFRYGGYAYGEGEILTVPVGGPTGIPTDPSKTFEEFQITVDKIFTDNFNGWSIGQLQVLDKFDDLFNGVTRDFRLLLNTQPISIQASPGSSIEVDQTLLIFINDVLQEPGKGFVFTGGSTVEFTEPPKVGDTSKVLFYKGSGDIDVIFTDIVETVKVGDTLDINNLPPSQGILFDENPRTVTGINTLDSVQTNVYTGPGITSDRNTLRPVTWCKQTVDKIINGKEVGKDRTQYEPQIFPTSYIIQPVGLGSTEAYVDSVRPLFDSRNESQIRDFQNSITITSQDNIVGASGTSIVSTAGTVTSISITNAGLGYTVAPTVTIGSTLGVTTIATATATITSGVVNSVTITDGGGYYSEPPVVIFEQPKITKESINVSSYEGDYGTIVGFGTTTVGSETRMIFDLFIDQGSFLRDTNIVGSAITVSGISTGDFFTVYNSNIGDGTFTSLASDNTTVVGTTTSFVDGVWSVRDHQTLTTNVIGIGSTVVRRVFCNISGISTVSFSSTTLSFDSSLFTYDSQLVKVFSGGISSSFSFGKFSWGRIQFEPRPNPREYNSYNDNGYVGISTAGLIQRSKPLKFVNYI